jgi:multidrug resistance efflux pump
MNKRILLLLTVVAIAAFAFSTTNSAGVDSGEALVITDCLVSPVDDVEVPAREAGVITELALKRGDHIRSGELIAQLDDEMADAAKDVAKLEADAAGEVAQDDSGVRYAKAAADVAHAEYEGAIEANQETQGTFSPWDVRRLKLTANRSDVQIEKDALEHRVAGVTHRIKNAELKQAERLVKRRRIESPASGVIVTLYKEKGEWVAPGDPVARVVSVSRLRVEGFVPADKYAPREILGKPVTVTVSPVRDHVETFESKISFVSPVVEASGEYRVWAEIDNRLDGPYWAARPGLLATMTVHFEE